MSDLKAAGHDYYTPGYPAPAYGNTMAERLQKSLGKNVTVFVGEDMSSVSGMLHHVGADYVEVHRTGAEGTSEAVLVPMQQISAVSAPLDSVSHHP